MVAAAAAPPVNDMELEALRLKVQRAELRARDKFVQMLSFKAAEPSRLRKDLRGPRGSADYVLWREREKVVNVSRALALRSPIYHGFVERIIDLTIGSGLVPVGNTRGGAADTAARLFIEWADTGADARGLCDWGALQRGYLRETLIAGDTLGIKVVAGGEQALQNIESERIGQSSRTIRIRRQDHEPSVVDGIEMDAAGKPVKYHIQNYDITGSAIGSQSYAVDAQHVVYMAWRNRQSQTRGVPYLVTGLDRLAGMDEYIDAVETAAKLQAAWAIIVRSRSPGGMQRKLTTGTQNAAPSPAAGDEDSSGVRNLTDASPGQVMVIGETEGVDSLQGSQPSASFDMFTKGVLRIIAAGAGIPVEIGIVDFSDANFSVARMADTAGRNTVSPLRQLHTNRLCWPIYRWRMARLIALGMLPDSPEVYDVRWQAPARASIDPEKEVRAAVLAITNNLDSKKNYLEQQGRDWDVVSQERADEIADEERMGIEPPVTPGSAAVTDQDKPQEPKSGADDDPTKEIAAEK